MSTKYNNLSETDKESKRNCGKEAESVLQTTEHFVFLLFYIFCF